MIEKHYGFEDTPFAKNMQSSRLFLAESQEEAVSRLTHVAENRLFGLMTGECGTGKTTVIRRLTDSLDPREFTVLYIADSKLTPRHFYNGLLSQLNRDGAFYRGDCRRKLHQEIENLYQIKHRKLVVINDEAHLLDNEMLQEVRFLINYKMDSENPLALILSGQPELERNLDREKARAIKQRIDCRCQLELFTLAETGEYIEHHMRAAGAKEKIFSDSAVREIYAYSIGSARLINKACTNCLLCGLSRKEKVIDGTMVKEVIESELI